MKRVWAGVLRVWRSPWCVLVLWLCYLAMVAQALTAAGTTEARIAFSLALLLPVAGVLASVVSLAGRVRR